MLCSLWVMILLALQTVLLKLQSTSYIIRNKKCTIFVLNVGSLGRPIYALNTVGSTRRLRRMSVISALSNGEMVWVQSPWRPRIQPNDAVHRLRDQEDGMNEACTNICILCFQRLTAGWQFLVRRQSQCATAAISCYYFHWWILQDMPICTPWLFSIGSAMSEGAQKRYSCERGCKLLLRPTREKFCCGTAGLDEVGIQIEWGASNSLLTPDIIVV